MALLVYKFGGTSVGSPTLIKAVAATVLRGLANGDKVVVVVSAMSGTTDELVELAKQMQETPTAREMDALLATGEQVTVALLSMALHDLACPARSYTGSQVRVITDDVHGKARISKVEQEKIKADLAQGVVVVVAGFQGVDQHGNITTLGRGGSDTTAVALAAALQATECRIYTDVDGIYTTDPRIEPNAKRLDKITFEEMLEMASLGSKVLQIRAVEFAGKYNVALRVLSSFQEGDGTLISYQEPTVESAVISGIAINKDEAKLTITGVPDLPGVAAKILCPIADQNIEIDMIIQNIAADTSTDFTFTVHRKDYQQSKALLEKTRQDLHAKQVSGDANIVKVSLVGVGMRSHASIASKMFKVLADADINIIMIATSEIKISVVVDESRGEDAVRALHRAFELSS